MVTFGKRTADRQSDRAQQEYYVKNFKDPRTDIRFLWDDPKSNFVEIKQHFDKPNKMSYPCAKFEGADACIGCDYPVEHPEWADLDEYFPGLSFSDAKDKRKKDDPGWNTRDVSSKWLFPAIDPKGYVSVYSIGYGFWSDLCALFDLMGTLTDKDYAIIRSGDSWNTTSYQAQAISQPYAREAKVAVPTADNISSVLGGKYVYAMEKYGLDTSGMEDTTPAPTPAEKPAFDPAPVVDPANPASHALPAAVHTEVKNPGDPGSEALAAAQNKRADLALPGPDQTMLGFNPKEADSGEIRDWLTAQGVDFPPKAPRTVLTKLAEAKIAEDPAPF